MHFALRSETRAICSALAPSVYIKRATRRDAHRHGDRPSNGDAAAFLVFLSLFFFFAF